MALGFGIDADDAAFALPSLRVRVREPMLPHRSKPGSALLAPTPATDWRKPRVAVLLCTFNGARFLSDQLTSLAAQSYGNWRLVASDDGSHDDTLELLSRFAATQLDRSRVEVRRGPKAGATANFLSLACDTSIEADCFAYCDQDDVWARDKLARAIAVLRRVPDGVPALYCSRTRLITADGRPYGYSPRFSKSPSFRNALVQNLGGGNTMVFNRAARDLLARAAGHEVVAHDWWTYMLVIGAGGTVVYDPEPSLDYRQHGNNQVGANNGMLASAKRLVMVANGRFSRWNAMNTRALLSCAHLLTAENRSVLKAFRDIREGRSVPRRLHGAFKAGLYRQTKRGQFALLAAAAMGRL